MNSSARSLWIALVATALIAFSCFAIPIYVIRPFRYQGARELAVALAVLRVGPVLSGLAAAVGIVVATLLWKARPRWWTRSVAVAGALVACGGAVLARVNIYELLLFHGVGTPEYLSIKDAKLQPDEMVLAVRSAGASRAYPIVSIAYHHVVNDWLGGQPIVATY